MVASVDPRTQKPHLYQTCPSGNLYEYYASAVGARSQSARTYLEKHADSYADATKDDLIVHALQALVGCVSGDDELTKDNASISVLGVNEKLIIIEGDDLQPYLDRDSRSLVMDPIGLIWKLILRVLPHISWAI